MNMRFLIFTLILMPFTVFAGIPSTAYVQQQVANQIADSISTKVDTSATANQTMAGTYTVTGAMYAPTPTLPTAE